MKKITLIITGLLILLCSCVTDSYLIPSESSGNKLTFDKGNAFQTANTENLSVSASGQKAAQPLNSLLMTIENKSEDSYNFTDNQISFYGGNQETGKWDFIRTWNGIDFISDRTAEAKATKTTANIIGFLAILDSLANDNPADFWDTAFLTDIITDEIEWNVDADLYQKKEETLLSKTIAPNEKITGLVYFPTDRVYPDYKMVFKDNEETEEFIFNRSDRDEIIHPWSCDRQRDMFALTYSHSLMSERMGFDAMWLAPKGVGTFAGMYYDPKEDISSWPVGLTIKCSPHTWLLTGFEAGRIDEEHWILAPQLGINASYNWTDVIFKCSYDIPSKTTMVDAGIGIAL